VNSQYSSAVTDIASYLVTDSFQSACAKACYSSRADSFRITGAQPDGDTIRFTPNDPGRWDLITGDTRGKRNASGAGSQAEHAGSSAASRPTEKA